MSKQFIEMTFVLPCSDTATNTTLCTCCIPNAVADPATAVGIMPSTSTHTDTAAMLSPIENTAQSDIVDVEETCVLTMENCWQHDDKSFFRDQISLLERDVYAKATKLLVLPSWKKLPAMVENLQDLGCLRVAGCGHKFSGVPLLYAMMTGGFKCPICRFGGNTDINLGKMVQGDFPLDLWEILCVLSTVVRKRNVIERNHEAHFSTLQLARQTITVVYQSMPWVVRFVMYKETNPKMHNVPSAEISLQMVMDSAALHGRQGIWPDDIVLGVGARGSEARKLSSHMRASGSFYVEIVIDIETVRHVVFQSSNMHYKHSGCTARPQVCLHTEATIGACEIKFEKCPYRNENLLQNVTYRVPETQLRALIIGIAGLV